MSPSDLTLNDTGRSQYAWLEICTYPRKCVGWRGFPLSEWSSCLETLTLPRTTKCYITGISRTADIRRIIRMIGLLGIPHTRNQFSVANDK